jgi:hypothetical protein
MKFWEQDSKVLDQMLSLNLRSSWALARAVVPAILRQGDEAAARYGVSAKPTVDPSSIHKTHLRQIQRDGRSGNSGLCTINDFQEAPMNADVNRLSGHGLRRTCAIRSGLFTFKVRISLSEGAGEKGDPDDKEN